MGMEFLFREMERFRAGKLETVTVVTTERLL